MESARKFECLFEFLLEFRQSEKALKALKVPKARENLDFLVFCSIIVHKSPKESSFLHIVVSRTILSSG